MTVSKSTKFIMLYIYHCPLSARARAKPERAAGVHMKRRGFPPIFSKTVRPFRSGQVGKSSGGASEREVCKIFLIGQGIRNFC